MKQDAVLCPGCDHILDTSFLGEDALPDPLSGPPTDAHAVPSSVAGPGDALILGDPRDGTESFLSDNTGGFLTSPTGEVQRFIHPVNVYVDAGTRAMLAPDAVLKVAPTFDPSAVTLSPFERHVLAQIDGHRPTARVRKLCGLTRSDLNIALALLADRGVVELVGHARPTPEELETFSDYPTDVRPPPGALESDIDTTELQRLLATSSAGEAPVAGDGGPNPFTDRTTGAPPTPKPIPPLPAAPSPSPAAGPRPSPAPAAGSPAPKAAPWVSRQDQLKAEQLYRLALSDVREGRLARARMYALTARELNPAEKSIGSSSTTGGGPARSPTPPRSRPRRSSSSCGLRPPSARAITTRRSPCSKRP